MKIFIDGDACPKQVKEVVFKSALKNKIEVSVVANAYQTVPASSFIKLVVVDEGPDVADQWIVDHVLPLNLVITSDIPLAALAVDKGALVLTPYGKVYDDSNVKDALASRNLLMELRQGGQQIGGQKPFGAKDREKFANAFSRWIDRRNKSTAKS